MKSSGNRKTLANHPLSRKRSNLPSIQGVVWILLSVILAIASSLLFWVVHVVNTPDNINNNINNNKSHLGAPVMEPLNAAQAKETFGSRSKTMIAQLRSDFEQRYGSYTKKLKAHGVQRFTANPMAMAGRILRAAADRRPFRMAFAGYSVTVGRGNFFRQSYPFVLQQILAPVFQNIFHMELLVRNAAIGGIPSFPYAFCLEHFLGPTPDVISWDYSMNENGRDNTAVLEAYIRHSQHQLSQTRPMIISLDTHKGRCDLLKQYTEQNLLQDALCVGKADAVFSKTELTIFEKESSAASKSSLPLGLQEWAEFGAPRNCPGRSGWHPKKKEHELIAWMIAMEFVDAMEQAVQVAETDAHWINTYSSHSEFLVPTEPTFPKPLSKTLPDNKQAPAIDRLLFGHEMENGEFQIRHVSCRTNFLPATAHTKVLPNIVVSGLASSSTADNIMTPRSDKEYTTGWVLDVSSLERDTKVKVEKCGGLGYEDMKIALYGTPESGPLRLWLPIESSHLLDDHHGAHSHKFEQDELLASHWMDSLVLCEANEKRSADACHLDQDLEVTVGGVAVPTTSMVVVRGAGEYLKRPTCVHVPLPEKAQLTRLDQLKPFHGDTAVDDTTR